MNKGLLFLWNTCKTGIYKAEYDIFDMSRFAKFAFVVSAVFCLFYSQAASQNSYENEAELIKKANELFEEEEFIEAYPLFSQLLAIYSKEGVYNYKFGVCMLYSVAEKEKAILYLEIASKYSDAEPEVWFYLGKAYHVNYRFNDAIVSYNKYKQVGAAKKVAKYHVDRQIEMCNNGKKLLKNLTELEVLDKKELSKADFFRSYDLTEFNAKLIVTPDEFKTDFDKKKKKENFIMYSEQGKDEIYFASYGKDGKAGKDIYVKRKLPNGEYGKPIALGYPVNTEYDEDFPFLHPSGKILYFCSKGHNSMGGYDVFKSERNDLTGTWSKPVNMDFAINTPDDDFMFVSDANDKIGYFASTRESSGEMVTVYKIKIERKPAEIAIIAGKVKREDGKTGLGAKITVRDAYSEAVLGIFNSQDITGSYLINLPNGGRFSFTVEAPGFKPYSESVQIPVQFELKPIGQDIILKKEDNGTEIVKIVNKFDQSVSDADYLLAMQFIKNKAKLDVNSTEQNTSTEVASNDSIDEEKNTNTETKTDYTNEEIIKIAYDDAQDVQKEANELQKDADQALVISSQKNEEAIQKKKELDDAEQNNSSPEKINQLQKEADKISQETVAAFNLASKLEDDAKKKQKEADFALKYAKDLERAMQSSTNTEVITKLNDQKEALDKMQEQKTSTPDEYSVNLDKQAQQKQNEADKSKTKSEDAKQDIVDLESEVVRLQKDADAQKNAELKQSLLDQIAETKTDIQEKQKEADAADLKSKQLQTEADKLKTQADYADVLVSQLKDDKVSTATVSSIDKNKLEQQVATYQVTSTETQNTTEPTITKTETNVTQPTQTYQDVYAQQLKDAETIPNQYEKEKKKSEIYANWSADAKKEQADLKKNLNNLKTKQEKDEAKKKILYLDAVVSEKNQQAEFTADNAKKIKEQEATTTQTNTQTTKEPELVVTKEEFKSVNTKYEDKVKQVDAMPEGYEKEKAKEEVYTQWSNELKQKEDKLKEQRDTTTNLNAKIAVQDAINQVSVQTKEKDQLADASSKQADKIKEQTTTANTQTKDSVKTDNTQQPETTVVVVDKKDFNEQITEAENIKEAYKRDSVKSEIYNEWVNDIKLERDSLSGVLVKTKNKKQKEALKTKIDNLDKQIEQTQALANENFSSYVKEKETASIQLVSSQTKSTEAEIAYNKASEEHKVEFTKNNNELQTLAEKKYEGDETKIAQAELLQDEAEILFQGAQSEKDKAKNLTGTEKEVALTKAQKMETDALVKQGEAKKIYASMKVVSVITTTTTNTQTKDSVKTDNTQVATNTQTKDSVKTDNTQTNTQQVNSNPEVVSTTEYKQYEAIKQETNNLKSTANADYKKAAELKQLSDKQSQQSQDLIESTATITDATKQKEVLKQAEELDKQSLKNLHDADSVKQVAVKTEELANTKQKQSESYLQTLDKTKSEEIFTAYKESNPLPEIIIVTEPVVTTETKTEPIVKTETKTEPEVKTETKTEPIVKTETKTEPVVKTETKTENKMPEIIMVNTPVDKIEIKDKPTYTNTKPIPVDAKLPEGLIFKVQIGAFKNKIPQNTFKGLTPINAETTPYGYTRYTAGFFTNPDKALNARDQIRGLGYKDAFVVAFYNGKRISYEEAMEMVKNGTTPVTENNTIVKTETKTEPEIKTETKTEPVVKTETKIEPEVKTETKTEPVTTQINDVKSTDVKSVTGLFYTVQVGVYSKKVTSAQLYGVKPLNSELLANGLIRYTSGTYKDVASASKAKDVIVQKGIKDAFVTAYYNGKRISVEEAAVIVAEKGTSIINTGDGKQNDPPLIKEPEVKEPEIKTPEVKQPEVKVDTTKKFVPVPNTAFATDTGLVYKVQIGAYKDQVPLNIATQFVKIASQGISTAKQDNGITLLTVGSFKTYDEAVKARNAIAEQGVDAFVIATKMNKKVFIQQQLDDGEE